MVIFDTNLIIDYLHGEERAMRIIDTYIGRERLSITCINEYELLKGAGIAGEELLNMLLSGFNIYYPNQNSIRMAANIYRRLKQKGRLIDDADILIASIACENGETLITQDSDFERIGLKNIKVIE